MFGLTTMELPARNPRRGAPPKTVHLIHPHTSELPATLPFGKALEENMVRAGIKTTAHVTTDLMQRGWELKKALAGEFRGMEPQDFQVLLDSALSTSDLLSRLRALSGLSADPDAFCLELHSYIHPGCAFFLGRTAWRLDGTELVSDSTFPRLLPFGLLQEMVRRLRNLGEGIADFAFWAAGLNFKSVEAEFRGLYASLKGARGRMSFIEIPADHLPLSKSHPMYQEYYDASGGLKGQQLSFEQGYLSGYHVSRCRPSETDIRQAMALATLPEK